MAEDYLKALQSTEAEIADLLAERERIDAKINLLKRLTVVYDQLLTQYAPAAQHPRLSDHIDQIVSDLGITEAIRQVLSKSKVPLAVPEIKAALAHIGVDLSNYANAGAVIHNTLARLIKQQEVIGVKNAVGQTIAYAMASNNAIRDRLINAANQIVGPKE